MQTSVILTPSSLKTIVIGISNDWRISVLFFIIIVNKYCNWKPSEIIKDGWRWSVGKIRLNWTSSSFSGTPLTISIEWIVLINVQI